MKRLLFYGLMWCAWMVRGLRKRKYYMFFVTAAHRLQGVRFDGPARYIHANAMLDPSGGLLLGARIVISTNVIILTHDYSYTVGLLAAGREVENDMALLRPVRIGQTCFIGAGAIVLPGSEIGAFSVIGAGAVVKGKFPDYSIIAGNPAKIIGDTKEWGHKILGRFQGNEVHWDEE